MKIFRAILLLWLFISLTFYLSSCTYTPVDMRTLCPQAYPVQCPSTHSIVQPDKQSTRPRPNE